MNTYFSYPSSNTLSPGLPVEQTREGRVQSTTHQLLSPDHGRRDPEHYHVQAGQEAQGSVWASIGKENGTWVPLRFFPLLFATIELLSRHIYPHCFELVRGYVFFSSIHPRWVDCLTILPTIRVIFISGVVFFWCVGLLIPLCIHIPVEHIMHSPTSVPHECVAWTVPLSPVPWPVSPGGVCGWRQYAG